MPALFVGNLPYSATEPDLEALFLQHGFKPTSVRVILDRETQRSRGFGFVDLEDPAECGRAKTQIDGAFLQNRQLSVRDADSKPERTRGRDGGGQRPQRAFSTPRAPNYPDAVEVSHGPDRRSPGRARRQARRDREKQRGGW
jgi:RNA recognition motif-containing protein